jgi:hypothetical protein
MGGMQLIPITPRKAPTTAVQREAWISQYQRSGLSARAFAQTHRLNLTTFYGWLKKARPSTSDRRPVVFQELPPLGALRPADHPWAMEIETAAGLRIRLR